MDTRVSCDSICLSCEEEHGGQCHSGQLDLEHHLCMWMDSMLGGGYNCASMAVGWYARD